VFAENERQLDLPRLRLGKMFPDGLVEFNDVVVMESVKNLTSDLSVANEASVSERSQLVGDR